MRRSGRSWRTWRYTSFCASLSRWTSGEPTGICLTFAAQTCIFLLNRESDLPYYKHHVRSMACKRNVALRLTGAHSLHCIGLITPQKVRSSGKKSFWASFVVDFSISFYSIEKIVNPLNSSRFVWSHSVWMSSAYMDEINDFEND